MLNHVARYLTIGYEASESISTWFEMCNVTLLQNGIQDGVGVFARPGAGKSIFLHQDNNTSSSNQRQSMKCCNRLPFWIMIIIHILKNK